MWRSGNALWTVLAVMLSTCCAQTIIDSNGFSVPARGTLTINAGEQYDNSTDNTQHSVLAGNGNATTSTTINNNGFIRSFSTSTTVFAFGRETRDFVTLNNNGIISSTARAVSLNQNAVINNFGTITGVFSDSSTTTQPIAVVNFNTGTLTNNSGGIIENTANAVAGERVTAVGVDFSGSIVNQSGGIIRANGTIAGNNTNSGVIAVWISGDNATLSNFGTIEALGTTSSSSPQRHIGVYVRDDEDGRITNAGNITASKDGIEVHRLADRTQITNQSTGLIRGIYGNGILFGTNVPTNSTFTGTVNNAGRIEGWGGDGISVDGFANITNSGTIEAGLGTNSTISAWSEADTNPFCAVSMGAGNLTNSGTLNSQHNGLYIAASNTTTGLITGGATGAAQVANSGTIHGQKGYGVRFYDTAATNGGAGWNDTLVNSGTIIGGNGTAIEMGRGNDTITLNTGSNITGTVSAGDGNDVLTNSGTITGANGVAISMGAGNDVVTLNNGSVITGVVDGGTHTTGDTLNFNLVGMTQDKLNRLNNGEVVTVGGITLQNFETITAISLSGFSGSVTSTDAQSFAAILDASTGQPSAEYVALLTAAQRNANLESVLSQLSPRAFKDLLNINLNSATQTIQLVNQRLASVRVNGAQFDASGLRVWDATMERALQNTATHLASVTTSHSTDRPAFRVPTTILPAEQRWSLYLNGSAGMARQGATADSLKSDYTLAGGTLGGDYRVTESIAVGTFGGYSHIDANLDEVGSTSEIETGSLGLYATQRWGALFFDSVFAYGHNVYDNKRMVQGTANTSKPEGDQFSLQAKLGHEFKAGAWTLIPEVSAQFTKLTLDRFTESGGNALKIQAQEVDSLRSTAGGMVRYDWQHAWGRLTPRARAAWVHEFLNNRRNILYNALDPAYIATTGILPTSPPDRDFAVIGCGVESTFAEKWATTLDYDFEIGREKFTSHQINAGVRYSF